jgi:hypothetical protein
VFPFLYLPSRFLASLFASFSRAFLSALFGRKALLLGLGFAMPGAAPISFVAAREKFVVSEHGNKQQQNSLHCSADISSIFRPFYTSEVGIRIFSLR